MTTFLYHLYNIIILPLIYIGFQMATLFNSKVRRGKRGRQALFQNLQNILENYTNKNPRFWIHNSSMGEFEQAKPIIQELKERFPKCVVIVSFYSPSGLEHVGDQINIDCLCYLPFDSKTEARRFISMVHPDVAILIRHDFWPNHLYELKKQQIPSMLVNCSIHYHLYLRWPFIKNVFYYLYHMFDLICTVSVESKTVLEKFGFNESIVKIVGDTRYDQVVKRAAEAERIVAPLRKVKGDRKGLVAGSTWPADENIIYEALHQLNHFQKRLWVVLVPHEPSIERINQIKEHLENFNIQYCCFSELKEKQSNFCQVLIVDRIGILASLYALGEISYVGGGFGIGIHNVLEPAALGNVVIFGPRCHNSYEAGQLQKRGVGFVVKNTDDLYQQLHTFLEKPSRLKELGIRATQLVSDNVGATQRIVDHIEPFIDHIDQS